MKSTTLLQVLSLIAIFIVALVLEVIPWPVGFQGLRPSWLVLFLTYWVLATPNKINLGYTFLLGIIWDLVLGSILGIHALVLSVAIYFVARHYNALRNLSITLQALLMFAFCLAIHFGVFFVELVLHGARFHFQEIIGSLLSGLLWPWVFYLMRLIRRSLQLR